MENIIDNVFYIKLVLKLPSPNYCGENNSIELFPVMSKRLETLVEVALTTPSCCIKSLFEFFKFPCCILCMWTAFINSDQRFSVGFASGKRDLDL